VTLPLPEPAAGTLAACDKKPGKRQLAFARALSVCLLCNDYSVPTAYGH